MSDDNLALLRALLEEAVSDSNKDAGRALDIINRLAVREVVSDEERAFVMNLFEEEN